MSSAIESSDSSAPSVEEQLTELATACEALMLENATLTKIISADAQLLAAHALIKQLTREVDSLRERNAGLMEEKNQAIRAARSAVAAQKKKVI